MIAIITPSGGRPAQFNLCKYFMKRQTYLGKVVWVIMDDCIPISTDSVEIDFRDNWTIIKIYPIPIWEEGQNTQVRNISLGIEMLLRMYNKDEIEGIFIIEDDDYYKPEYLERMILRLKGFFITGEKNTIYYNVAYRRYIDNGNIYHTSLFQTAFTVDALPNLEKSYSDRFIDAALWNSLQNKNLFNEGNLSIGIKGMPGRYGIGAGHGNAGNMIEDKDFSYLKLIIGGEDAKLYERYS